MRPRLVALGGGRPPALVRLVALSLSAAAALAAADRSTTLPWIAPLAVLAVLASTGHRRPREVALLTILEGLVTGLAVVASGSDHSPFLPYLVAPAFAGGLRLGVRGGVPPIGTAALTMLVAPLVSDQELGSYASADTGEWLVLAVLVAAVASWVRAVLVSTERDPEAAQEEAFRLLTALRDVARHLPGTLDPTTTGEVILERARERVRYDVGAVLVGESDSPQLSVLVRRGAERPRWDLAMTSRGPLAEAWRTREAISVPRRLATGDEAPVGGSALVVPLVAGGRPMALLVLESSVAHAFPQGTGDAVQELVSDLVLQLQTGLVFAEVRELATYEERRRLAREIHDGIAQELASVAYALDSVALDVTGDRRVAGQVEMIQAEVRRLITELRMSLFDLRSEVTSDEGLGAAVSRHLHQVGSASGMTVHLSLNEAPVRLGVEVEAELLRIVQEAVANARKHARAANLWVTCTVDPPSAQITVEDDGSGVEREAPNGSHGLAIMRERAARIRAGLTVEGRPEGGTRVRVSLGKVTS